MKKEQGENPAWLIPAIDHKNELEFSRRIGDSSREIKKLPQKAVKIETGSTESVSVQVEDVRVIHQALSRRDNSKARFSIVVDERGTILTFRKEDGTCSEAQIIFNFLHNKVILSGVESSLDPQLCAQFKEIYEKKSLQRILKK
jgi:hypothetical protein